MNLDKKNVFYFLLGVFFAMVGSAVAVRLYDLGYPGFTTLQEILFGIGVVAIILAFLFKPLKEVKEKKEDKEESDKKSEEKSEKKEEKEEKKDEKKEEKKEDKE